jgi:hypothetical protein
MWGKGGPAARSSPSPHTRALRKPTLNYTAKLIKMVNRTGSGDINKKGKLHAHRPDIALPVVDGKVTWSHGELDTNVYMLAELKKEVLSAASNTNPTPLADGAESPWAKRDCQVCMVATLWEDFTDCGFGRLSIGRQSARASRPSTRPRRSGSRRVRVRRFREPSRRGKLAA